ncbi:MAG: AsmA family protein [Hyphomicrobium sp.]
MPPKPSGGGFLSALFYLTLLLLIVVGSAVGYLAINPPSDLIRQTLAEQVKARTGRDLVVAGPANFSFYPGLGVSLKDVSLSGPPGSNATLVKMAALDVSVKAAPLLSREVSVDRIVLSKPIFDLRVDKAGKKNWDFTEAATPVRYAQAVDGANDAGTTGKPLPARLAKIKALQLDDVRIEDGVLRYTDERTGQTQQVEAVNVRVSAPSLDAPIVASGDLDWRGETTAFGGQLANARVVIEEKPAALQFKASNKRFAATYDGKILIKDGADLDGQIAASSESARGLATWLDTTLPPVAGFGPLKITGRLTTAGDATSLKNATFGLDDATAKGDITVTRGGVRPAVQANLSIDQLDLNKYLTTAAGGDTREATPKAKSAPAQAPAQAKPGDGDQIEELLNSPKTKVYGAAQRAGWSSEPFNLALLGVADVDAKLAVGKLLFQDLKVGQSAATVALKNRVLKTQFDDVQLYEGRGKGAVTIDGTGAGAGIGAAFALDGVSALPFLNDAAKMTWLSGKTKLDLQVTAAGANQLQLVESLNGKAGFALADGAVVGFNLPGFIRNLSKGQFSGLKTAPSEKTDFSQLTATFTIDEGVAKNSDLQLVSPLLRVTGAGAVQLPPRTLDYTVKPKVVASLEGQQGESALSGLEVPVRITGPWDKPKIEPTLKGVIADPDAAVDTIKDLSKQYKGKNAGEIVDDLFKKDEKGSSKAKDLLNKFLKPKTAEPEPAQP